jgi:hypothetical protein
LEYWDLIQNNSKRKSLNFSVEYISCPIYSKKEKSCF